MENEMKKLASFFQQITEPYVRWVIKHKYTALVISLVIALVSASGGGNLKMGTDYRVFFDTENPNLLEFEKIQKVYSKDDNIIFILESKDNKIFKAEHLVAIEWLTEKAWELAYSQRVNSITNFQHTRAEGDNLYVADLVEDAKNAGSEKIAYAKKVALNEPLLVHRLISEKAHVSGVNVVYNLPKNDSTALRKAISEARELKKNFEQRYPNFIVHFAGILALNNAFFEMSINDMSTLVPLMYLLILVISFIFLRSVTAVIAIFFVILSSIMTGMGWAGHIGFPLTPPSSMAPTIIMTLAVADSIHLLYVFLKNMREGLSKEEALVQSFKMNMLPVFLTTVTTLVGFLSLNTLGIPPFRHLGNITAIGVAAAFTYSILLLPAIISILPVRVKKVSSQDKLGLMTKLAEFVIARRKVVLFSTVSIVIALSALLPQLYLDDNPLDYFSKSTQFRQDNDFALKNLTGTQTIDFSLGSGEDGGISNVAYLQKLEEFSIWLRKQPEVMHVDSFTDVMKRLNRSMHGDDQAWYKIPQERELAAQYLLLYEMSLPKGLDLNNQIDIGKSSTRLTVTLYESTQNVMLALESRINKWLVDNTPKHMHAVAASPMIIFSHIGSQNVIGIVQGSLIALLLISFVLMLTLRSLRMGVISLVPNLVPVIMSFGFWALLVAQLDIAFSIVGAIALGIIVDDTVHFLTKYLRARREGKSADDAVRYSFAHVGMPLVVTTVVLISGFLVLGLSPFRMNWSMGFMVGLTLLFALVMDFLLLPALLLIVDKKKHPRTKIHA